MALDVGDRTIGVAVSDPLGITAEPLTVIRRTESVKADLRAVESLIAQYEVSSIVVGLPIMLAGEEGVQAGKVRDFVDRLIKRVRISVVLWDERLTTVEAERVLEDAKRDERRANVDKIAAAVILQSYLASRKEKGCSA